MLGSFTDGATARVWGVKLPATLAAALFVQEQVWKEYNEIKQCVSFSQLDLFS